MMMKTPLCICCVVFALSGCTSTRIVALHSEGFQKDALNVAELQQRIHETAVDMFLTDGRMLTGRVAHIGEDSLRWVNNENDSTCSVPVKSVVRIEKRNHAGGALVGLLTCGAGGGLLGWAYGSSVSRGDMRELGVAIHTLAGAAMGAFIGLLFGGGHGLLQVYQFQEEPADTTVTSLTGERPD